MHLGVSRLPVEDVRFRQQPGFESHVRERIAEHERELTSNPSDVEGWIVLANLYGLELGELARAVEVLHQGVGACDSARDKAQLHAHAAELLMIGNHLMEAKTEIETSLMLQPDEPEYWDKFILIGCRLGIYKELLTKITEWEQRNPGSYVARRCKRAVQRFKTFSRARPKHGFSYKEEVYGLYGAAALGLPEDNGIDIWKYYFYTFDEHSVARVLFRLVSLLRGLRLPLSSVVSAEDGFSLPIALATAAMLDLPVKQVGEDFRGERPILVKAWGYETQSLMEDRKKIEATGPARLYSFVLSGTRIFEIEIPPDFCAVETAAPLNWEEDVECPDDSWIGRMDRTKAEKYAQNILDALDSIEDYEPNIEEQVEWYVKKHPHLACLDESL